MIWGALLIPVLVGVYLYMVHAHRLAPWELIVPMLPTILVILGMNVLGERVQTRDIEFWGSLADRVEFYEEWDEYIDQTCTEEYECGTSDNPQTCSRTYDCSYVDNHPEVYVLRSTNDESIEISRETYHRLTKQFGSRTVFKDLKRDYHRTDGDLYYCVWGGEKATAEPVTTVHTYENRVQASSTILNFEKVDPADIVRYGLYEYPSVKYAYHLSPVLGAAGEVERILEHEIGYLNGRYGKEYQIRVWMLIHKNQPRDAALKQMQHWKNGNKNEFVLSVGTNDAGRILWTYPFSWTEREQMKVEVRRDVEHLGELTPLTARMVALILEEQIITNWKRKEFADFSYLRVETPTWALVLTFIITMMLNIGIGVWIVKNEHHTS